ncbi:MAG: hypothetical protein UY95_C0031G0003 [Parcubacteria group bacterium GW2011_GWA2_56_7]|nr:MAG: hypothetical protein UY95_C0031G0003 [Parcubacteria group bacterium GW2011_GWA2_56_7]
MRKDVCGEGSAQAGKGDGERPRLLEGAILRSHVRDGSQAIGRFLASERFLDLVPVEHVHEVSAHRGKLVDGLRLKAMPFEDHAQDGVDKTQKICGLCLWFGTDLLGSCVLGRADDFRRADSKGSHAGEVRHLKIK